jgi:hypothetical protein
LKLGVGQVSGNKEFFFRPWYCAAINWHSLIFYCKPRFFIIACCLSFGLQVKCVFFTLETPRCKIFFTTDGSKPNPYQRSFAGRETTFKYRGPFTLKEGTRTLKAIAVTR